MPQSLTTDSLTTDSALTDPALTDPAIGIILGGGRSCRMGRDKALLLWRGSRFMDHMVKLLQGLGLSRIHILGRRDHPFAIADEVADQGPAAALSAFMHKHRDGTRFLVVPVDMPAVSGPMLQRLLDQKKSHYFDGQMMPALLVKTADMVPQVRLRDMLQQAGATRLSLTPDQAGRLHPCNTKTDLMWLRERYENSPV